MDPSPSGGERPARRARAPAQAGVHEGVVTLPERPEGIGDDRIMSIASHSTPTPLNDALPRELVRLALQQLHRACPFAPAPHVCTSWRDFYGEKDFWLQLCSQWPSSLKLPRPSEFSVAHARGLYLAYARGLDGRYDRESPPTPLGDLFGNVTDLNDPPWPAAPFPDDLMLVVEAETLLVQCEDNPPHRLVSSIRRTIAEVQPLDATKVPQDRRNYDGDYCFELPMDVTPLWEPITQIEPSARGSSRAGNVLVDQRMGLLHSSTATTLMALFHKTSRRICFIIRPRQPAYVEGTVGESGGIEDGYAFSHHGNGQPAMFDPWGRAKERLRQFIRGLGLPEEQGGDGGNAPPLEVSFHLHKSIMSLEFKASVAMPRSAWMGLFAKASWEGM